MHNIVRARSRTSKPSCSIGVGVRSLEKTGERKWGGLEKCAKCNGWCHGIFRCEHTRRSVTHPSSFDGPHFDPSSTFSAIVPSAARILYWIMNVRSKPVEVEVHAPICAAAAEILTPDALRFVGFLCHKFEDRRQALLAARASLSMEFDSGGVPHFVTHDGRLAGSRREPQSQYENPNWKCAPIPADVQDRRVEITGPVDRKMVINGLNSGANVYMADFEDSTSPTWSNLTEGQRNLRDAVRGTITYTNPKNGKVYAPKEKTAVLFVRPRGWHLNETHVTVNGKVASGSLFDFGLYFYHNVHQLIRNGTGPYYYIPKLEGYLEARLWNDVFVSAQQYLGVPIGTIRATVLLETITAAFQMEEVRENHCCRNDWRTQCFLAISNIIFLPLPN